MPSTRCRRGSPCPSAAATAALVAASDRPTGHFSPMTRPKNKASINPSNQVSCAIFQSILFSLI